MNRFAQFGITALLLLVGGVSCFAGRAEGCAYSSKYVRGTLMGFAAGPGEKSFDQSYAPQLTLPIGEQDFLKVLKSHHLDFEIYADGREAVCQDPPQWKNIIDGNIVRTYFITDRSRMTEGHGIHFAAFIGSDRKVVYVENRFTYEGP